MKSADFDILVSKLLRNGVILVGILLAIGWALQIDFSNNVFANFQDYQESSLSVALSEAWLNKNWGLLLSYGGLILLITLPLFRVIMSGILFAKQKEHEMTLLCLIVLFGLALSVFVGAVK